MEDDLTALRDKSRLLLQEADMKVVKHSDSSSRGQGEGGGKGVTWASQGCPWEGKMQGPQHPPDPWVSLTSSLRNCSVRLSNTAWPMMRIVNASIS